MSLHTFSYHWPLPIQQHLQRRNHFSHCFCKVLVCDYYGTEDLYYSATFFETHGSYITFTCGCIEKNIDTRDLFKVRTSFSPAQTPYCFGSHLGQSQTLSSSFVYGSTILRDQLSPAYQSNFFEIFGPHK